MRRPFVFMFALLALWMQILQPALAMHRAAAAGTAFDPTAIICDHLGGGHAPAHDGDDGDHPCCVGHHANHDGALVAPVATLGRAEVAATALPWIWNDDAAGPDRRLAHRRARGPPLTM